MRTPANEPEIQNATPEFSIYMFIECMDDQGACTPMGRGQSRGWFGQRKEFRAEEDLNARVRIRRWALSNGEGGLDA